MRKTAIEAVMVSLLVLNVQTIAQQSKPCPRPTAATDEKFLPGQVWSFKSRDFEPEATLTILRVESLPKIGKIIHVRVDGIRLRNCSGGPEPNGVEHAPFTRDAIERSATKLLRMTSVPSYEAGYNDWLKHCGGAYTITVGDMVVTDEKAFNSQSNCSLS